MSDKIDPAHKKLMIDPSHKNLKVPTFMILPNGRLILGQLEIGGNCVRFLPQVNLRSLEYAASRYKSRNMIQLLTDNIQKVATTDSLSVPRPQKIDVLRAVAGSKPSGRKLEHSITLPSPVQVRETPGTRYLDFELLNSILENPESSAYARINTITLPELNQDNPRYLKFYTFRGDEYIFFMTTNSLKKVLDEFLLFVMRCNSVNQSELLHETSGSEDFDFYELEPPQDRIKAADMITRLNTNQFGFHTRHCVHYNKKKTQTQKLTGAEQIEAIRAKQLREQKRKSNSKKYYTSKFTFQPSIFEYNKYYKTYGNLWPDSSVQQEWSAIRQRALSLNSSNTQLLSPSQIASEQSTSDLQIDLETEFPEQFQYKITRDILVNARNGHENSTALFDDALNDILLRCGFHGTNQVNTQQTCNFGSATSFYGRESLILSESDLRAAKRYLQPKYEVFRVLVQYQSPTDGTYLTNLFNSFSADLKYSFATQIAGDEICQQNICETVANAQDSAPTSNAPSANANPDNQQVNPTKHMKRALQLTNLYFMCFQMDSGTQIVVCVNEMPPTNYGRFGTHETFVLVKQKNESQYTQYQTNGANRVYMVKETDRLIIGSGGGSALTVFQNLIDATTASCETFGSPPLFEGRRCEKYVEGKLKNVELLRFVVGDDI